MKRCVHCQQTLVDRADVCHYCNRDQEESTQECLWCKQRIPSGVRVCYHCNRFINKGTQCFQSWIIPILVPILTFFLVLFAALQVQEARKERVSADLAARTAQDAQCRTIDPGLGFQIVMAKFSLLRNCVLFHSHL